ncbi:MAG TPA: DEAD/DEAH box helicase [Clostridia bacterium]|nr:DEAD/DEAH box helicase [Clostridia bacterium]
MHSHITYNPLQRETQKFVDKDCNVVVLAPTSSGKTIVAEQFLFPAMKAGKKGLYLSPLKALTNEKLLDWEKTQFSVVAITSDHESKPRPITEDLILMTTEALDSRTRGIKQWLTEVGVIVCDEAHMLTVSGRGDAMEVGLTRFANEINRDARIIFLSATIPNADELGEWLTVLNGKPTEVVTTEWRPIRQEHHLKTAKEKEWLFNDDAIDVIQRVQDKYPDDQMIIFVHSIGKGKTIAQRLGVPFHYSKVSKADRQNLEKLFKEKKIKTLVSTSTLAYGINLPADIGIIVGAHRGPTMVEAYDIIQMAGRVGRYGLSEKGLVYYVFKESYADMMWNQITNMHPVESQLASRLYFHITSFVCRENKQIDDIKYFVSKTLLGQQQEVDVEESINKLLKYGILKQNEDGMLIPTLIGKASAMMYVDPIDLVTLRENLKSKPVNPRDIAIAFTNIPSLDVPTYVPDDLKRKIDMGSGQQTILASALYSWLLGDDLFGTAAQVIPPYIADIERIMAALKIAGVSKSYLDTIQIRLTYGVNENMIDLVSIRGIGRKRAFALSRLGINNREDMLKKPTVVKNVLGTKLGMSVLAMIKDPTKPMIIY